VLHRAKCFYIGKTACVLISPEDRASRQALAKAVNKRFKAEGVSCGRGANLAVVMMNTKNEQQEFMPGKDVGWSSFAPLASRIYIKPLDSFEGE
jgi:hypothetical protein